MLIYTFNDHYRIDNIDIFCYKTLTFPTRYEISEIFKNLLIT